MTDQPPPPEPALVLTRRDLAVASFTAVAVGCFWAWPPLGLIVPGGIVFGFLSWSHVNGRTDAQPPPGV